MSGHDPTTVCRGSPPQLLKSTSAQPTEGVTKSTEASWNGPADHDAPGVLEDQDRPPLCVMYSFVPAIRYQEVGDPALKVRFPSVSRTEPGACGPKAEPSAATTSLRRQH